MTLRNCPLCGSNVIHYFEQGLARHNELEWWFIEKTEKFLECEECGHIASGWEEGEAEEEWNTKKPDEWEIRWWKKQCQEHL